MKLNFAGKVERLKDIVKKHLISHHFLVLVEACITVKFKADSSAQSILNQAILQLAKAILYKIHFIPSIKIY